MTMSVHAVKPRLRRVATPFSLPRITQPIWKGFGWYANRFVRRNFHALRVSHSGLPRLSALGAPTVIFLNHPSWWDPLICLLLAREFFPHRRHFAPIDADMLAKYRIFSHLGFFGVERGTRAGAASFLRTGAAIASEPGTCLWITAQGEFYDPRTRPVKLAAGLARLAVRTPALTQFIPLAIEYPFWSEREPEALAHFGAPLQNSDGGMFDQALEQTMDDLAHRAALRDPTAFRTIVRGAAGSALVYDAWRWAKSRLTGAEFSRSHLGEP